MSDFSDAVVRAAGVSSVTGAVGARIGGSVSAVLGPVAAGGAAAGGLIGAVGGFACSLCSDLLG